MATIPTQIRIDEDLKKQAVELSAQLGLDMSSAMNMFLRQCVLHEGIPFNVQLPKYKPEVMEAMEEARRIPALAHISTCLRSNHACRLRK